VPTESKDHKCTGTSVVDPGFSIRPFSHPGSGSKYFFIPDPEYLMKSGMQTYFFLASYAFRSKVLVIVKKIRDPEKTHPGSGFATLTGTGTLSNSSYILGNHFEIRYQ
jgi:hypothetical protein